jgi:hypothetical protein
MPDKNCCGFGTLIPTKTAQKPVFTAKHLSAAVTAHYQRAERFSRAASLQGLIPVPEHNHDESSLWRDGFGNPAKWVIGD